MNKSKLSVVFILSCLLLASQTVGAKEQQLIIKAIGTVYPGNYIDCPNLK